MDFKNIVLTTDLSDNAEAAAPYAVDFARKYGGTIHLLHVFEDYQYYLGTTEDAFAALTAAQTGWLATAQAERKILLETEATNLAASAAVPVLPVFLQGHAVEQIVKFADQTHADCIVIATHGFGASRTCCTARWRDA